MKSLKIALSLLFVCALTLTSYANTTTETAKETKSEVVSDIASIIDNATFNADKLAGKKVNVKFMVNADNEIIVLSTDNGALDQLFKNMLNYKKINAKGVQKHHVYVVPVTFENV